VGAVADGSLGPLTLAALSELSAPAVAARYNGHRLLFMTNLKTWSAFSGGWARRIALNLIG
jgi:lysozyme family protein